MTKGTVYGGVISLPQHPDSDIHGLLRCVIRTTSRLRASEALEMIGVKRPFALFLEGIWSESKSAVELLVTEQHYAEIMVCPLAAAYVSPEKYRRLPPAYTKTQRTA